jgi:hypothetical protein
VNCNYPNCIKAPTLVPVIAIPTFRTVGLHKPHLDREAVNNPNLVQLTGFHRERVIQQYEENVAEYNATVNNAVKTDKPTYLIGVGLCADHAKTYRFIDWFQPKEWRLLQEAGRAKGFHIPEPHLLTIEWKPLGWNPSQGYLEVER